MRGWVVCGLVGGGEILDSVHIASLGRHFLLRRSHITEKIPCYLRHIIPSVRMSQHGPYRRDFREI